MFKVTDYKMKRRSKTFIEDLNFSFLKSGIHLIEGYEEDRYGMLSYVSKKCLLERMYI